jgi:hypothetical protein
MQRVMVIIMVYNIFDYNIIKSKTTKKNIAVFLVISFFTTTTIFSLPSIMRTANTQEGEQI